MPSSFASVKFPAGLVSQAREAAMPMLRSVAGQIEYWATLRRIAEASGLTISEAREAIALYDVRQTNTVDAADPLDVIEADFVAAESTSRLAQAVRQTVQSNRRQVAKADRYQGSGLDVRHHTSHAHFIHQFLLRRLGR
jgi:HAMP domain-containing protein